MIKRIALLPCCLPLVASGAAVLACPVCDTGAGAQVRAGILDGNFAGTLVAVLLPFPVLLACVAMIHFGWPSRVRGRHRDDGGHDDA
jgi:hypothetical protein